VREHYDAAQEGHSYVYSPRPYSVHPDLRKIHEGLQVIENWNSANSFILYGKGGEFGSNKLEDQEILMLSLHLLQVSLV
jgi:TnpA family transposase